MRPLSDMSILPIGSVVRVASTDALAMVIGYEPVVGDERAEYLAVPYPMGLISDDSAIAFDRSSIGEIVFEGYVDEEGQKAFSAIRAYRQATDDMLDQVNRFIETLDDERVRELVERYAPAPLPEGFEVPEGYEDVIID